MFTKKEQHKLAAIVATTARVTMEGHGVLPRSQDEIQRLGQISLELGHKIAMDIGNNTVMNVEGFLLPEEFADVDEDLEAFARSSIYANTIQGDPAPYSRAGILGSFQLNVIVPGDGDSALAELEKRLYALFLATRRLRNLPAECHFVHTTDLMTGACLRCGERPIQ